MNILEILDRPIAFHRCFVTITGSITAALFLSQAVYWQGRTSDPDGWFYKTARDWSEETGMGRYEIEAARKKLASLGIIEETLRGVPATVHYRVNGSTLSATLKQSEGQQTRLLETSKLDVGKPANKIVGNQQTIKDRDYTETTAERERAARFIAPSLIQCREYAASQELPEDEGESFFNHHEARGWMLGKVKMKSWHAAFATWKKNARRFARESAPVAGTTEPLRGAALARKYGVG